MNAYNSTSQTVRTNIEYMLDNLNSNDVLSPMSLNILKSMIAALRDEYEQYDYMMFIMKLRKRIIEYKQQTKSKTGTDKYVYRYYSFRGCNYKDILYDILVYVDMMMCLKNYNTAINIYNKHYEQLQYTAKYTYEVLCTTMIKYILDIPSVTLLIDVFNILRLSMFNLYHAYDKMVLPYETSSMSLNEFNKRKYITDITAYIEYLKKLYIPIMMDIANTCEQLKPLLEDSTLKDIMYKLCHSDDSHPYNSYIVYISLALLTGTDIHALKTTNEVIYNPIYKRNDLEDDGEDEYDEYDYNSTIEHKYYDITEECTANNILKSIDTTLQLLDYKIHNKSTKILVTFNSNTRIAEVYASYDNMFNHDELTFDEGVCVPLLYAEAFIPQNKVNEISTRLLQDVYTKYAFYKKYSKRSKHFDITRVSKRVLLQNLNSLSANTLFNYVWDSIMNDINTSFIAGINEFKTHTKFCDRIYIKYNLTSSMNNIVRQFKKQTDDNCNKKMLAVYVKPDNTFDVIAILIDKYNQTHGYKDGTLIYDEEEHTYCLFNEQPRQCTSKLVIDKLLDLVSNVHIPFMLKLHEAPSDIHIYINTYMHALVDFVKDIKFPANDDYIISCCAQEVFKLVITEITKKFM